MTNNGKLKPYKKEYDYSYTIGAYPTLELLERIPAAVKEVYIHSKYEDFSKIIEYCQDNIPLYVCDKVFERIGVNNNSFILGVFCKYEMKLNINRPHIVLVNPSDMGNLGTIIRAVLGFGYKDIVIITPAADMWNPKTIRASMGAFFKLNIRCFDSFDQYKAEFSEHKLFPFMLNSNNYLNFENCPQTKLFSLVFGNEATGLDDSFLTVGTAIQIPQTSEVDSLNLAVATSIGAYTFSLKNKLL